MGIKISELNSVEEVQNEDVLPIVQNNETKKVSKEQLLGNVERAINANTNDIAQIKTEQEMQNTQIDKNEDDIEELQAVKADRTEIPTNLNQLSNADTKFVNETQLANAVQQETTARQQQDVELQNQIDAITSQSDVVDVVGTYAELLNYDISTITENDIVKVLQDNTHDNATSYFRWSNNSWAYVGSEGPYYTKGETDERLNLKANQTSLDTTNQNLNTLAGRVGTNETEITGIKAEQITQNRQIATLIADSGNKIELSVNSQTYILTATLKNKAGEILNSSQVDLPLEAMIVNATYDSTTKELVLTLQNGTTLRVSLADIVSGLVSQDDFDVLEVRVKNLEDDVADIKDEQDTQNTEIEELQEQVEILETTVNSELEDATATGESISVTDSANALAKLLPSGNTYQATNIKTYECEGTETGDYYFTYNSINYQFTMPTIEEGSVLAFNTDTLKLYLGETEIATTTDNTGTLITLQDTPSPEYPQQIHVVKGHNEFHIARNLYNPITAYEPPSARQNLINDILDFENNKQYYVYANNRPWVTVEEYTGTTLLKKYGATAGSTKVQFTVSPETDRITVTFYKGLVDFTDFTNVYFCEIDKYIPYNNAPQNYSLDLGPIELGGLNYTRDTFLKNVKESKYYDNSLMENDWYLYKATIKDNYENLVTGRIEKNTNVTKEGLLGFMVYLKNNHLAVVNKSEVVCSHFLSKTHAEHLVSEGICVSPFSAQVLLVSIDSARLSGDTTTEFDNYMKSINPTISYLLRTPEKIHITDSILINQLERLRNVLSNYGGTNITTISAGDLNPILNFDYKKSNRLRIENLENAVFNN